MRHAKESRRGSRGKAVLFFAALFAAMILSLLLPLRPASSAREKRDLTPFPEFSTERLLDGSFFRGIDDWFSDTFPYRDAFLDLNQRIRSLYGAQTVVIHGEAEQGDDIPDSPFTGE